jgi:diguanylate cyclase (GGDEF)-like protein/PAS domain S-box-containing protein
VDLPDREAGAVQSRILLVDDLRTNLLLLNQILQPLDLGLAEAASGEEALALLACESFDLVILDVCLPDMSGFDVARKLRASALNATAPIIFISTDFQSELDVANGYDLGCIDYLARPVNAEVLRAKARILCALARDRAQISAELDAVAVQKASLEKALAARKESERRYHAVVSQCPMGILVVRDGFVIFHNAAARRLLGIDPALYNSHFALLDFIAPVDHARVLGWLQEERDSQASLRGEPLFMQRSDGTIQETDLYFDAVVYDGQPAHQLMLQDVAERRREHVDLLRVQAAIEGARDAVVITDANGLPIFLNIAFGNLFGYTLDGLRVKGLGGVYARPAVASNHLRRILEGEEFDQEVRLVTRRGVIVEALFRGSVVLDDAYRVVGATFVFSDITERKRLENELRALSREDALTGLPNRRAYEQSLATEWRRALRNQRPLAVLLLDIDHFKAFNDHYGHPMGDACLRQVADVLRLGCRRSADTVARFGGEEFIAIFPETDAIDAAGVAEQMRASVADRAIPHGMAGELPMVTISIGVAALVPSNRLRAADLVRMADEALYAAKRAGRNQVVLGAANMIEQIAP